MRQAIIVSLLVLAFGPGRARAQELVIPDSLQARIWLDRGDEAVVKEGEDVRVYYRANVDGYGAIFRVDTDGRVHLVFPQHPGVDSAIRGGRDYRLLFEDAPRWRVRDDPGVGYFFMIASAEPLDFSLFDYDDRRGWDLSAVGDVVYEDPYVAIDDYVGAVLPDWDIVPHGLDFLEYNVDEEYEYPRFLCYDCHDSRSWSDWDPYEYQCPTYQVVIWDDPYYQPSFRYYGNMVVVMRPFGPRPRYEVAPRVRGTPWGPVVRQRPAPPRLVPVYKESPARPGLQRRPPVRPSVARGAVEQRGGVVTPRTSRAPAARPSARVRRTPDARPSTGSVRPSTGSARPPTRVKAPAARPTLRPSTQRPATQRPAAQPSRRGTSGPAVRPPSRPVERPAPRAAPGRPSGAASPPARPTSGRQPTRPSAPRATPPPAGRTPPAPARAAPRRPSGGASVPARRPRGGEAGEIVV